jgi:MFS family permease
MQVAGRVVLMCFSTRLETKEVGIAVMVLMPTALLTLLLLPHTLLWLGVVATLYGAGNGIMTIVRGIAVADLLGRDYYGALNGALTTPTTVAKALAPVGAAAVWSATGDPAMMLWAILASVLLSTVGFVLAISGASRSMAQTVSQDVEGGC